MALAVAVLPLLRRARRLAGPHSPAPVSRRVVAVVELLLIAAALAVPAALLADAVPWWRGRARRLVVRLGDRAADRRRHRRGPVHPRARPHARAARRGRRAGHPGGRAWTCSPVPGSSSTGWSATPPWRAAGTPGWAPWGWACSSPGRCCAAGGWPSGYAAAGGRPSWWRWAARPW